MESAKVGGRAGGTATPGARGPEGRRARGPPGCQGLAIPICAVCRRGRTRMQGLGRCGSNWHGDLASRGGRQGRRAAAATGRRRRPTKAHTGAAAARLHRLGDVRPAVRMLAPASGGSPLSGGAPPSRHSCSAPHAVAPPTPPYTPRSRSAYGCWRSWLACGGTSARRLRGSKGSRGSRGSSRGARPGGAHSQGRARWLDGTIAAAAPLKTHAATVVPPGRAARAAAASRLRAWHGPPTARPLPSRRAPPAPGPPGAGRMPLGAPEHGGALPLPPAFSLEPELRGALSASRRVGPLLLKAEEGEVQRVAAAAEELLRREYRWGAVWWPPPPTDVPCAPASRPACPCARRSAAGRPCHMLSLC